MFNILEVVTEFFEAVWGQVAWILLLVVLDFLLGVIQAVMKKEFTFSKLADFLATNVLLKVTGSIIFAFVMHMGEYLPGAFLPDEIFLYTPPVIFGILVLDVVLGSIVPHLAGIGIIPEAANKYLERAGVSKAKE